MKKICFVVPRYYPIVGGTEKLCQQVLEHALEKNEDYDISVITQPSPDRDKLALKYKVFDFHFQHSMFLKDHFEVMKYDLVIFFADLHTPYLNAFDTSWCKKSICVLNLDETTYGWKDNFKQATKNLKNMNLVVTFSKDGIANKFLEENKIKNTYIQNFSRDVLQSVFDPNIEVKLKLDKSKKTILYNAAIEKRKNQLRIIELISRSKKLQNYNWLFIGTTPEQDYFSDCIRTAKINNLGMVRFLKANPDYNVVDSLYKLCDLVLLASVAEGLPLVLLEALAANKPAISTPVGGVKGVLANSGIKILDSVMFPVEELEAAIEQQLENKENFRHHWENEFNKEVVCEKYNKLIKELL